LRLLGTHQTISNPASITGTGSENPPVFKKFQYNFRWLKCWWFWIVPVFVPIQTKKAPTQSFVSA
jgi:hypothetical protein